MMIIIIIIDSFASMSLCNISGLTLVTRHFQDHTYSNHMLATFIKHHGVPTPS